MANRRFEMYQYRQVLTRMRLGESDRAIARSGLIGRQKASALREVACREGWLEASSVMPDDATLAQVLQVPCSRPQSASSVLPYQDKVTAWWRQGIRGTVIHQALVDTYGYAGSYSSIRRFLQQLKGAHPDVTTVLDFDPGDVAQVDFGRGPTVKDVFTHQTIATWIFVMGAGLVSPPVCRDRTGSKGRDVAELPQKRLRVLRRRAGTRGNRQPQKRHHQGLLPRSEGAARLRRVRRRLWLHHLTVPRARPEEEGARGGCREVCQTQFCAPAPVPSHKRRQSAVAGLDPGAGR